mgnify:CR=1 FL=1
MNVIYGENGQGKTNLVEAVMLNALTKSPRTSRDDDMKRENTSHTEAEVCVERNFGDLTVKCILDDETKKKFFINSKRLSKAPSICSPSIIKILYLICI